MVLGAILQSLESSNRRPVSHNLPTHNIPGIWLGPDLCVRRQQGKIAAVKTSPRIGDRRDSENEERKMAASVIALTLAGQNRRFTDCWMFLREINRATCPESLNLSQENSIFVLCARYGQETRFCAPWPILPLTWSDSSMIV